MPVSVPVVPSASVVAPRLSPQLQGPAVGSSTGSGSLGAAKGRAGATPATASTPASAQAFARDNSEKCEVLRFRYELCMEHASETMPIGMGNFVVPCVSLYEEVMATCGSSF
jgi:hypothetical protein